MLRVTLDVLRSPEDWRWLWSPEPIPTQSSSPAQNLPPQPWCGVSNVNLLSTSTPNVQNTYVPFAALLLLDTLNAPASYNLAPSVENSVMWTPVVQPQLWLTHPLSFFFQ